MALLRTRWSADRKTIRTIIALFLSICTKCCTNTYPSFTSQRPASTNSPELTACHIYFLKQMQKMIMNNATINSDSFCFRVDKSRLCFCLDMRFLSSSKISQKLQWYLKMDIQVQPGPLNLIPTAEFETWKQRINTQYRELPPRAQIRYTPDK